MILMHVFHFVISVSQEHDSVYTIFVLVVNGINYVVMYSHIFDYDYAGSSPCQVWERLNSLSCIFSSHEIVYIHNLPCTV